MSTWPSLSSLGEDRHHYSPVVLARWRRVFTRIAARTVWHWQGLLHWLLPRAHLRGWATPWPGTETVFQYHRQSDRLRGMNAHISAATLLELVELRNKMGFETAFLGNDKVLEAIRIARSSAGVMARLRGAAHAERGPPTSSTASSNPGFGPRGGLPRDKAGLQAVARGMKLDDTGTIAQLTVRIKEATKDLPKTQAAADRVRREAAASGGAKQSTACASGAGSRPTTAAPARSPAARSPEPAQVPPTAEEMRQQVQQEVQQMGQSMAQGVAMEVLRLLQQGAAPQQAMPEAPPGSVFPDVETFDMAQMDLDGLMVDGTDYSFPTA